MKKILLSIFLMCVMTSAWAEKIILDTGRVVEGHIIEVTDEYVRMFTDNRIVKLRFRNMSIESAEQYRDYEPKPFEVPHIEQDIVVPKTYRDYANEGLKLASEEKYEEAIEAFSDAIEIRSEIPDFYGYRGMAYQALKKFDEAEEDYTTAIMRDPENPDFYARRAWLYQTQDLTMKAIDDYSRVLELDPYNVEILLERYNLNQKIERWWNAKKDVDYLIRLEPEFGGYYVDQAILNYRIGSFYNAWQSVYDATKRGVELPAEFIEALQEKMPDPFLKEKPEEPSLMDRAAVFFAANKFYLLIAFVCGLLGIVVLLIPSKAKPEKDALDQAVEQEEAALRLVTFVKAPLARRGCAFFIDLIIISVFSWAVQIISSADLFTPVFLIIFLCREGFGGESIGKSLMGLRVIDEHGRRAIFFQGFIRNFILVMPLIVFYALFWGQGFVLNTIGRTAFLVVYAFFMMESLVVMLSKKEGRRLGDRMAGTYVHDLNPGWVRWPFVVLGTLLMAGFFVGNIVLNRTFNKAFLYRLNPLAYYNAEDQIYLAVPRGWKRLKEGDGGVIFEHADYESMMVLVKNEQASDYALSLCASAFTKSMEEGGLVLRTEEEMMVSGTTAYKKGLMDPATNSAIMVVYFKKENFGTLYIFQVTSPIQHMRHVMSDATKMLESMRFD